MQQQLPHALPSQAALAGPVAVTKICLMTPGLTIFDTLALCACQYLNKSSLLYAGDTSASRIVAAAGGSAEAFSYEIFMPWS